MPEAYRDTNPVRLPGNRRKPTSWLTHLNFGAYHLRLAFISGSAQGSWRKIIEVILWIRRM